MEKKEIIIIIIITILLILLFSYWQRNESYQEGYIFGVNDVKTNFSITKIYYEYGCIDGCVFTAEITYNNEPLSECIDKCQEVYG